MTTIMRVGYKEPVDPSRRPFPLPDRPPPYPTKQSSPYLLIRKESDSTRKNFRVPYSPREVVYTGFGTRWEEMARDGLRDPLLVPAAKELRRFSCSLTFATASLQDSIEDDLNMMRAFKRSKSPLVITWSHFETGLWVMTNMTINAMNRTRSGEISRAVVEVEFTEASVMKRKLSPKDGGRDGDEDDRDRPKRYTVKKGDTLQKIADKHYKKHTAWKRIAKANGIKNPKSNKELKVGRVLKLP